MAALIKHAHSLRFKGPNPQDNPNIMEVTEDWIKELKASPYYSRNPHYLISIKVIMAPASCC